MVISKGVSLYKGLWLAVFTTGWNIQWPSGHQLNALPQGRERLPSVTLNLQKFQLILRLYFAGTLFTQFECLIFSCGYIDRYWLVQSSGSHVELELQHFKAPGCKHFILHEMEAYMYMDIKIQHSHHKAGKQQTWLAGRAQWWECSPLTSVTRVRFPTYM